jgi:hypothetical protein
MARSGPELHQALPNAPSCVTDVRSIPVARPLLPVCGAENKQADTAGIYSPYLGTRSYTPSRRIPYKSGGMSCASYLECWCRSSVERVMRCKCFAVATEIGESIGWKWKCDCLRSPINVAKSFTAAFHWPESSSRDLKDLRESKTSIFSRSRLRGWLWHPRLNAWHCESVFRAFSTKRSNFFAVPLLLWVASLNSSRGAAHPELCARTYWVQAQAKPPVCSSFHPQLTQLTNLDNLAAMGKTPHVYIIKSTKEEITNCLFIVATSDILTIISLVVATILGLGAIWATRRYNNTTRRNAFHFQYPSLQKVLNLTVVLF